MDNFGNRLRAQMSTKGHLCVGIDPHPELLEAWDLEDNVQGLECFSLRVLDAVGEQAAVFKPQSALFERHGAAGIGVLERVLRTIKDAGALSILDVKRGDIGSTMAAYAQAYLDPNAPLVADAITLSPFLGYESLRPALDLAKQNGKGAFVLTLTSNTEGAQVQLANTSEGNTVSAAILHSVSRDNAAAGASETLGSIGMVIGATVGSKISGIRSLLQDANAPFLVPGLGAQGGTSEQLRELFGQVIGNILASSSRGILKAGPSEKSLKNAFVQQLESVEGVIA